MLSLLNSVKHHATDLYSLMYSIRLWSGLQFTKFAVQQGLSEPFPRFRSFWQALL